MNEIPARSVGIRAEEILLSGKSMNTRFDPSLPINKPDSKSTLSRTVKNSCFPKRILSSGEKTNTAAVNLFSNCRMLSRFDLEEANKSSCHIYGKKPDLSRQ
jgi:hypothetical protein